MHFAKRADDKKDQFEEIPHDLSEEVREQISSIL